jgi:hypothetical protein
MFGKVLASSVAAIVATTSLYAIPKGPCDQKPADVCCEEPKPGPFGFAFPMDMGLTCPRDFYVHVDGLAFQAKQDGMEWGIDDANGAAAGAPITHGRVMGFSNDHTDWDYNPGMRFGIGFYLDHDAWNVDFNWTWLNITDYKHGNSNTAGGAILPMWLTGDDTPATLFGARTSAVWDASYNTIDARLAKPYHVSRYLIFNPHFGIRAAWIDQHFSVDYGGTNGMALTRTIHHGDNDFWGIGARAGIDTDWVLGKGWCLFGNIAASMLFGKFEVDQNMTYPASQSGEGFDLKYDFYQNTPNFEIAIGIGWGRYFDKNKYHVGLKAAYEFHEWWDQLNMRRFWDGAIHYTNVVVSRGNLTLNGFSLRLQLDI